MGDLAAILVVLVLVVAMYSGRPSTRHVAIAWMIAVAVFASRPAISVGTASLRLENVMALICAIDLVVVGVRPSRRVRRSTQLTKARRPLTDVVTATALLASFWILWAAVVSYFRAPVRGESLTIVLWFGLNLLIALWVARTPGAFRHLIRALAVVAAVVGTVGIGVYLLGTATGTQYFGLQDDSGYGGYALSGVSIEANILAGVMCLVGILALANPAAVVPTWCSRYLPILAPTVILAAHTRAALVAYAVGVAVVAVSRHQARARAVVIAGLVAPVLVWYVLTSNDSGLAKFAQVFDVSSGTGAFRWEHSRLALSEWLHSDALLTGLGVNTFGQRHLDLTQPGLKDYLGNLPLQVLYDTGLVGFAVLLLCVMLVLGAYFRRRRGALAIALVVPYLAFSIATSSMWLLSTWVFVGLAWAGLRSTGHANTTVGVSREGMSLGVGHRRPRTPRAGGRW